MHTFDRTRRLILASGLALPLTAFAGRAGAIPTTPVPLRLTDVQWRRRLTPAAYAVLRGHATERPFSSPLEREHRKGIFACAGCALPPYSSAAKFDSGTGWPSFTAALRGAVFTGVDRSIPPPRTEVHCSRCAGHLGHVFDDGPPPTGLRYCMNGVALTFQRFPSSNRCAGRTADRPPGVASIAGTRRRTTTC